MRRRLDEMEERCYGLERRLEELKERIGELDMNLLRIHYQIHERIDKLEKKPAPRTEAECGPPVATITFTEEELRHLINTLNEDDWTRPKLLGARTRLLDKC